MRVVLVAASLVWGGGLVAADEPAAVFAAVCSGCHGLQGEGKVETSAPSIAGLPRWFGVIQLGKFRDGVRGTHHQDLPGAQMQAIAAALTPEFIPRMAAHLESMKPLPTQAPPDGNASRGGELFEEICAKCHRFNGQGEQAFRSAPLTTLSGYYIANSLRKFRDGVRGYHDGDEEGPKMREVAKLFGDQQIDDLVAYIAVLAEKYPPGASVRAERDRRITPTAVSPDR
jgi:cytochrome c oxidase subunit II